MSESAAPASRNARQSVVPDVVVAWKLPRRESASARRAAIVQEYARLVVRRLSGVGNLVATGAGPGVPDEAVVSLPQHDPVAARGRVDGFEPLADQLLAGELVVESLQPFLHRAAFGTPALPGALRLGAFETRLAPGANRQGAVRRDGS